LLSKCVCKYTHLSLAPGPCLLDNNHSDWSEMESQGCFDLHFFLYLLAIFTSLKTVDLFIY
jgi:hypothetical protein